MIMPVVGDTLNRRELSESKNARMRIRVVPQTHSRYACQVFIRGVPHCDASRTEEGRRQRSQELYVLRVFQTRIANHLGFETNGLHNPETYPEGQRWAVPSCLASLWPQSKCYPCPKSRSSGPCWRYDLLGLSRARVRGDVHPRWGSHVTSMLSQYGL